MFPLLTRHETFSSDAEFWAHQIQLAMWKTWMDHQSEIARTAEGTWPDPSAQGGTPSSAAPATASPFGLYDFGPGYSAYPAHPAIHSAEANGQASLGALFQKHIQRKVSELGNEPAPTGEPPTYRDIGEAFGALGVVVVGVVTGDDVLRDTGIEVLQEQRETNKEILIVLGSRGRGKAQGGPRVSPGSGTPRVSNWRTSRGGRKGSSEPKGCASAKARAASAHSTHVSGGFQERSGAAIRQANGCI